MSAVSAFKDEYKAIHVNLHVNWGSARGQVPVWKHKGKLHKTKKILVKVCKAQININIGRYQLIM